MMEVLVNVLAVIEPSASITGSGADEINSALNMVLSVCDTLVTVIYIILGAFLIIKGALLGMQIVKAADEPQVRQEKIGSLKWLVIGVAIAFGVAVAADLLIGYFSKTTGVNL